MAVIILVFESSRIHKESGTYNSQWVGIPSDIHRISHISVAQENNVSQEVGTPWKTI